MGSGVHAQQHQCPQGNHRPTSMYSEFQRLHAPSSSVAARDVRGSSLDADAPREPSSVLSGQTGVGRSAPVAMTDRLHPAWLYEKAAPKIGIDASPAQRSLPASRSTPALLSPPAQRSPPARLSPPAQRLPPAQRSTPAKSPPPAQRSPPARRSIPAQNPEASGAWVARCPGTMFP